MERGGPFIQYMTDVLMRTEETPNTEERQAETGGGGGSGDVGMSQGAPPAPGNL